MNTQLVIDLVLTVDFFNFNVIYNFEKNHLNFYVIHKFKCLNDHSLSEDNS